MFDSSCYKYCSCFQYENPLIPKNAIGMPLQKKSVTFGSIHITLKLAEISLITLEKDRHDECL